MSEWWTYAPSDFLLFSARTYHRLFELHNAALWPLPILAVALGIALIGAIGFDRRWQGRALCTVLAVLWLFVGWSFVLGRYAPINWAAPYLFAGFAAQAALLLWFGAVHDGLRFAWRKSVAGIAALALCLYGLALLPLQAVLFGRPWQQAEVFAVAPDPTAVVTLGMLLAAEGRGRLSLMALPLLWCLVSFVTLQSLGAADAWPMAGAILLALLAASVRGKRARQQDRR